MLLQVHALPSAASLGPALFVYGYQPPSSNVSGDSGATSGRPPNGLYGTAEPHPSELAVASFGVAHEASLKGSNPATYAYRDTYRPYGGQGSAADNYTMVRARRSHHARGASPARRAVPALPPASTVRR